MRASGGANLAPINTPFALAFGNLGLPILALIHFVKQIL
jgi:hypothetical protein